MFSLSVVYTFSIYRHILKSETVKIVPFVACLIQDSQDSGKPGKVREVNFRSVKTWKDQEILEKELLNFLI